MLTLIRICGSLVVVILSVVNSKMYCPEEERIILCVTVFAGVDDIECFARDMSNVTQLWLEMSDVQG